MQLSLIHYAIVTAIDTYTICNYNCDISIRGAKQGGLFENKKKFGDGGPTTNFLPKITFYTVA